MPPNDDMDEVVIVGASSLDEFLSQAEEIVEDIQEAFPAKAKADLQQMENLVKHLGPDDFNSEAANAIREISLDLKGMGGSFGYHLTTEICASLHKYLAKLDEAGDTPDPKIIRAHLSALGTILEEDIKGDGGESGAKVAAQLHMIVAAALGEELPEAPAEEPAATDDSSDGESTSAESRS